MELVHSRRLWSKFLKANGYMLVSCIGQGSFGDVYSVTCLETGQPWAVKRLVARRDIQEDSYAMAEIEALASIQHPTVIGLKEILLCPRLACIVMELAPAGNLEVLVLERRDQSILCSMGDLDLSSIAMRKLGYCSLDHDGHFVMPNTEEEKHSSLETDVQAGCGIGITCEDFSTEEDAIHKTVIGKRNSVCLSEEDEMDSLPVACCCGTPPPFPSCPTPALDPAFLSIAFIQITSALEFCHDLDLAHRDVNPSNVLVFRPDLVKLADFGLCFACRDKERAIDKANGEAASEILCADFLGRDHYTAPEVRRHEPFLAKQADVWSLGCVLYFMLRADHPPLKTVDLLEGMAGEFCKLIPAGYDLTLGKKCLATIGRACQFRMRDRPTMKDILAMWDT
ncbi:testis-specific serine/threonine-protein kinase 3-like [Elysia marginata]|uniref:non-specific serine/threonine protein kinase n=1 Tax=Elysia marginata TaxID=1093978 RepID=A0AAV4ID52_9GAST|nr:testis-specific serine/threonine-protein kinase 3-like [Elysia marginata]